jgi:hypothetical protein
MATTLNELAKRLEQVEQEVARLGQLLERLSPAEASADCRVPLLSEARANQAAISAAAAKAFEEMEITGEPIGAERVQEMMLACGIDPKDNAFSRGIIDMRDE